MATIETFAARVQAEKGVHYAVEFPRSIPPTVTIAAGPKYTRVDVGPSGKYMVVNATGEIYGIKAYGVIHRGHAYGTLDTIDLWDWGGYVAVRKAAR